MNKGAKKLSGVFAPVTTPFNNDEVDLKALQGNLQKLRTTTLTGFLALGSNGEFLTLSEREERQVMEVFAAEKGDKVVMVGAGCESSYHTLRKIRGVAELGFPFASVLTPRYFAKQLNDATMEEFYLRLAEGSPIPIVLYNAPEYTGGVSISPSSLQRIASHQNVAGIKDSSKVGPGVFLSLLENREDFAVLAGSANFFYPSLHLGAAGGVLSLGNFLPEECCRLYRYFQEGAFDEALRLHDRLVRINRAVSGSFGVAGVKGAMDLLGYNGGFPRRPLQGLTAADLEKIKKAIAKEGFPHG
jgi:4-hydroxy-2-oxoglutarate aldolase